MVELYEENIEEWYKYKKDETSLTDYLCEKSGILKDNEKGWFLLKVEKNIYLIKWLISF